MRKRGPPHKVPLAAYLEPDPVRAAHFFLGKVLCVRRREGLTAGVITETEAYGGLEDKASHAYNGRRTARTEVMFGPGGHAYVYLCYGIHHLFNIVTGPAGVPMAVLIRAVCLIEGHALAAQRRPGISPSEWANGPGKVTATLGIDARHRGAALTGDRIWIEDRGWRPPARQISRTPRIGVPYAEEYAHAPWRLVWEMS
jgi:DNA-3-methyladenine glycosylase